MIVKLVPPTDKDALTYTRTLQSCLDRLQGGADYRVWGDMLRTLGTQWLGRSPEHDVSILR
jgi:hypothetical protein